MITIGNINVDTASSPDELMTEWALFTVEFEYDCKILMCHTFGQSVFRGIKKLVESILSSKMENIELRRALLSSKYITVDVIKSMKSYIPETAPLSNKKDIVLEEKYRLIKECSTYYPFGYNVLTDNSLMAEEFMYKAHLYNELIKEMSASDLYVPSCLRVIQRGRPGKRVHKFNAKTGLYLESYNSVKEAAIATNTYPSNISACCNDKLGQKTTGGFKWSYEKDMVFID